MKNNQKTYFTKHLPVEGEIKEGDYFLKSGSKEPELCAMGHFYTTEGREKVLNVQLCSMPTQKVKLFLCSRDIQVGDKLTSLVEKLDAIVTSHEPDPEDMGEKYYIDLSNGEKGLIYTLSDDPNHPPNITVWFKVVGEVSPDALSYVKEGQEFDEHQLGHLSSKSKEVYIFGTLSPKIMGDSFFVAVKGPCSHFH